MAFFVVAACQKTGAPCTSSANCPGAQVCCEGICAKECNPVALEDWLNRCGNGILEMGEECDDGEGNSNTEANACRITCLRATCGDGVVDTGEACDGESDLTHTSCLECALVCDAGYSGTDCTSCADGYSAASDGSCSNQSCSLENVCSGHGTCDDSSGSAVCTCDANFSGDSCESCTTGYTGDDCTTCASGYVDDGSGGCTSDLCAPTDVCGGHGTCDSSTGAVVCTCEEHFSGDACENCAIGYSGEGCTACADGYVPDGDGNCLGDCSVENICHQAGTCDDSSGSAVCTCETNFSGDGCESCAGSYSGADCGCGDSALGTAEICDYSAGTQDGSCTSTCALSCSTHSSEDYWDCASETCDCTLWALNHVGAGDFRLLDVVTTSQGIVHIGEFSTSAVLRDTTGAATRLLASGLDGYAVNSDQHGVHQWSKTFASTTLEGAASGRDESLVAIDVADNGDVRIGGSFCKSASEASNDCQIVLGETPYRTGSANTNTSNAFIASYAADGTFQWAQVLTSSADVQAKAILNQSDGSVILVGVYKGEPIFSGVALAESTGQGMFLSKYSSTGVFQWVHAEPTTGASHFIEARSVAGYETESTKEIFLGAFLNGTSANLGAANGGDDILLLKYLDDGSGLDLDWSHRIHNNNYQRSWGVAVDGNGNAYFTGYNYSSISFPDACSSTSWSGSRTLGYVAKFSNAGACQWLDYIRYGGGNGIGTDDTDSLSYDVDIFNGNPLVSAFSGNQHRGNFSLIQYNGDDGSRLWTQHIEGSLDAYPRVKMSAMDSNTIVLGGRYSSAQAMVLPLAQKDGVLQSKGVQVCESSETQCDVYGSFLVRFGPDAYDGF